MTEKPDFKKFAAELVSPSKLFESALRSPARAAESIALLGSLSQITKLNLSLDGVSEPQLAPETQPTAQAPCASPIQYATSREEYRKALEDHRITQALAKLASHREKATHTRAVIRPNDPSSPNDKSGPFSQSFQQTSIPSVNVSLKPSPANQPRLRPSSCQPILRET